MSESKALSRPAMQPPEQRYEQTCDRDLACFDAAVERRKRDGGRCMPTGPNAQIPQHRRKTQTVNEPEAKRQFPARTLYLAKEIFEADLDDRRRNQRFDDAARNEHEARGCECQGDRMGHCESGNCLDDVTPPAKHDEYSCEKEQMVVPREDMPDAQRKESRDGRIGVAAYLGNIGRHRSRVRVQHPLHENPSVARPERDQLAMAARETGHDR